MRPADRTRTPLTWESSISPPVSRGDSPSAGVGKLLLTHFWPEYDPDLLVQQALSLMMVLSWRPGKAKPTGHAGDVTRFFMKQRFRSALTKSRGDKHGQSGREKAGRTTPKCELPEITSSMPKGSALIEVGDTRVICAATIEDKAPLFLRGEGKGWITAEYGMLPCATGSRTPREAVRGRVGGRTHEIQRLIGRSLRAVVDPSALGERDDLAGLRRNPGGWWYQDGIHHGGLCCDG